MLTDMTNERAKFILHEKYSSNSFAEVEKRVYSNPEIMTYHMHGLVLAQFLWFEQYARFLFFKNNINNYCSHAKSYLEIGGGHGLYINKAIELLKEVNKFDLVDVSKSSIDLAKGILGDSKITYFLKNIYDYTDDINYDFVTIGEVLEHLEEPHLILLKVSRLIGETGVAFVSTPVNSPMIDHIYLFKNVQDIRRMINTSGLEIIEEKVVVSENITLEDAARFKIPVMFAAFIKNKRNK